MTAGRDRHFSIAAYREMIRTNNFRIIESVDELPRPKSIDRIYADFETTSFDDKQIGVFPYLGHRACGYAFTWDDHKYVYYVPMRHTAPSSTNIEPELAISYFEELLFRSKTWINQNVNFDAHVANADGVDISYENPRLSHLKLIDTLSGFKMLDSDRLGHDLKDIARSWLGLDMEEETELEAYLKSIKSKDYGRAPIDLLGRYACQDVEAVRTGITFIEEKMPEGMKPLWEMECKLTPVLYDMERDGLRVDELERKKLQFKALRRMAEIEEEIEDLTGVRLVESNNCSYDIVCNQLGLPVLARGKPTKDGSRNPSFNADAMKLYLGHPDVVTNEKARRVIRLMTRYREHSQNNKLFFTKFKELADQNGFIHPIYNQIVRTGRFSGHDPNIQQNNDVASRLIIPDDETQAFLCLDASQMEFRIIAHLCRNQEILDAYENDPDTDYHDWVKDRFGVSRSAGKTINFAIAFNATEPRVVNELRSDPTIIREVGQQVDEEIASGKLPEMSRSYRYAELVEARASGAYHEYHSTFPEIQATAVKTQGKCALRGYSLNCYGRRRHLPKRFSYIAWNAVVQGGAMDVIKDGMIRVAPRYNREMRELGFRLRANKHDELLMSGPIEAVEDTSISTDIATLLENPEYAFQHMKKKPAPTKTGFRVPFRWDRKTSRKNWKDAKP